MTFEQWWAKIYFRDNAEKQRLKSSYAACWNTAIDAVEDQTVITDDIMKTIVLPSIRAKV